MRPVSDALLLTVAQIAATLIGLLLVGVVFYVETGLRRLADIPQAGPFVRVTTKLLLGLYGLVLVISLALLVFDGVAVGVLFLVVSVSILTTMVSWTRRTRDLSTVIAVAGASPWFAWPMVAAPLALPWLLGGWAPDREAFTAAILVVGGLAFVNTAGLLLVAFDLSAYQRAVRPKEAVGRQG